MTHTISYRGMHMHGQALSMTINLEFLHLMTSLEESFAR